MTPISAPTAPQWTAVQTLAELPANLTWSGTQPVPAIGTRVRVYMNSFGPALVRAYFHAEGYLGVVCRPDQLPAWFQQQNSGVQEPRRQLEPFQLLPPLATAIDHAQQAGQEMAEQLARAAHGLSQAEEINAQTLGQLNDWIPDYPPLEDVQE
jgi:hypothetical protein